MNLIRRDENSREFLLFALTPPRLATAADRLQQVADTTIQRLQDLDLDGLILYDIDDEAERNPAQRPFPFTPSSTPRVPRRQPRQVADASDRLPSGRQARP